MEYHDLSGALNESIADVFGIVYKHWNTSTKIPNTPDADWTIARDIVVMGNGIFSPLRSFEKPGQAFQNSNGFGSDPQVGHFTDYKKITIDHGGVHIYSGIPNLAFCRAAKNINTPIWETIGQIWYKALTMTCEKDEFATFAHKTVLIANKEYSEAIANIIGNAWLSVGVRPEKTQQSPFSFSETNEVLKRISDTSSIFIGAIATSFCYEVNARIRRLATLTNSLNISYPEESLLLYELENPSSTLAILENASFTARDNPRIINTGIKNFGSNAYLYASKRVKEMPIVLHNAMHSKIDDGNNQKGLLLKHSGKLRGSKDAVLDAISVTPSALQHAKAHLKNDWAIGRFATDRDPMVLQFLGLELRNDPAFIRPIVKKYPSAYIYAGFEILDQFPSVEEFLSQSDF